MKIRLREHAKFQADKMAKIALAATPRVLLDLYALEPGQAQKVHSHDGAGQDLLVLEGRGRFSVGGSDETLEAGEAHGGGRGRRARRRQRSAARLLVLVLVVATAAARVSPPLRAAFMVTCLGDMFYPEVGERDRAPAARLGVTVDFPAGQTCCGLPLFNSGLPRTTPRPVGRAHGRASSTAPSTWWCRRAPAPGWSSTSTPGCSADAGGRARPPSAGRPAPSELSQFLVNMLGRRRLRQRASRARSRTTTPAICCAACTSRRARATLLRELAGRAVGRAAGRGRVLRLRRLVLGAAARGVHRRSSTRSSPTSRPPAPTCVVACDAGCLMQMRGGLSRRGSRVRALHLAEVLDPRSGRLVSDGDLATPFRERATRALGDRFLQEALTIATTKFITLRQEAFGDYPEGEALRDRARAIKEATLQHLDQHLERLIDNVERRGGHVHYASTAEDARRIVLDIARRAGPAWP